jgi:hypothetical protein
MQAIEETLFPGLARWNRRRTPADFEFLIADRIDAVNPAWWDEVTANDSVFFSRAYLAMLERQMPANMSPCYALLSRRGRPLAALVMQKIELDAERLLPPAATGADWKQRIRQRVRAIASKPLDRGRVLVLGNLISYGQHAVAASADVAPSELWHGIAEAMYRVRRAEKLEGGAHVHLVKDLVGEHIERAARLTDFGYRAAETETNMVLALDPSWTSYADYLASLSSKYRKNTTSRVLAPFDDPAYRIGVIANPSAVADRLHELYRAVHDAADLRPFTLPPAYWRALPETFGASLRVVGIWQHERLVGFVVMLLDRDRTAFAYHIGFDRAAAETAPVYLRLLHAAVAEGIAMGATRISLGRTALEPKAALGARPERMVVYARHRQPIVNKLLRGLLGQIAHDAAPERNPFKQGAAA